MAGQGKVKSPSKDRRFAANREGPTGGGVVKSPSDGRLMKNRVRNRFIRKLALSETSELAVLDVAVGPIPAEAFLQIQRQD